MSTAISDRLTAQGRPLDTSPSAFGELRAFEGDPGDGNALASGLEQDGYLFVPGFFPRDQVLEVRHDLLSGIAEIGWLQPGTDPDDARPTEAANRSMLSDIARDSQLLQQLLYSGRIIDLYTALFGEEVRHFDFTWLRAYPPGHGTGPHMDSVFMNRGTLRLMTAWVPMGDITTDLGGLAVLEGSHRLDEIRNDYGTRDVDAYCSNHDGADAAAETDTLLWGGTISDDPIALREELGLRWLTTEFRAGDLVTFPIYTIHIGLDNNSDRLRLSTDSRYQRASEPADPRWIGANPTAHGSKSKEGMIC